MHAISTKRLYPHHESLGFLYEPPCTAAGSRKGRRAYRRYLHSLSSKMAHFCQDTEVMESD